LFNVHEVNKVRQSEVKTAVSLVSEPSAFVFELAIERLKSHKSPGADHIPVELFKQVGRKIRFEIHKLINFIWKKEELSEEWKESIIVPVSKKGNKEIYSNYRGLSLFQTAYKILNLR